MTPRERQLQLDYAREVLAVMQVRYRRVEKLAPTGAMSEQDLENAWLELLKAELDVALLEDETMAKNAPADPQAVEALKAAGAAKGLGDLPWAEILPLLLQLFKLVKDALEEPPTAE